MKEKPCKYFDWDSGLFEKAGLCLFLIIDVMEENCKKSNCEHKEHVLNKKEENQD